MKTYPINNKKHLVVNLQEKANFAQEKENAKKWIAERAERLGMTDTNGTLKAGDVVSFLSGYNNDIRYTTEIVAFDKDGLAYLVWDCWWVGIDLTERKYRLTK